jgi:hypothetical protein
MIEMISPRNKISNIKIVIGAAISHSQLYQLIKGIGILTIINIKWKIRMIQDRIENLSYHFFHIERLSTSS